MFLLGKIISATSFPLFLTIRLLLSPSVACHFWAEEVVLGGEREEVAVFCFVCVGSRVVDFLGRGGRFVFCKDRVCKVFSTRAGVRGWRFSLALHG